LSLRRRGSQDLEHYDPKVGMTRIAVQEAAEKHWRRAKDATRLMEAVEAKLAEQRRFVLWWDQQEKRRHVSKAPLQTNDAAKIADFGLDRDTLHRWRMRLRDDAR
jgi:hypothetical protein